MLASAIQLPVGVCVEAVKQSRNAFYYLFDLVVSHGLRSGQRCKVKS